MNISRFRNILRYVVVLAALLSALLSCARMESSQEGEVGYLSAPVLDVDVTVDDLNQTKALDFEIEAPSASEVHFIVKDKDGKVVYEGDGPWGEPLVLPTGAYTIDASVGVNGFGSPFFWGTASGTVSALDVATPSILLKLANALIKVTADESLTGHFIPGDKVILTPGSYEAPYGQWFYAPSVDSLSLALKGSNSAGNPAEFVYTLSSVAAKTAYTVCCNKPSSDWPEIKLPAQLSAGAFEGGLYFSPPMVSNISETNLKKLTYQVKGGAYSDWTEVTVSDVEGYKYISGLVNGESYKLRACLGNIVSGESDFSPVSLLSCLELKASAAHNNTGNPSVQLQNTIVKAAVSSSLPAIVEELGVVTATTSFANSDGINKLKTSSLEVNAVEKEMENIDGWPYLPHGKYSFKSDVTCSLPGGRSVTESLSTEVEVPKPEFSVVLNAYTSYDKYAGTNGNASDLNAANSLTDASAMYDISGGAGIAVALLDNPSYGVKNFKMTMYHSDTKNTETLSEVNASEGFGTNMATIGTKSGLSWTRHDLAVSMTFDGVTVTKTNNHHITGLPHNMDFKVSSTGWGLYDNCSRDNEGLHFNPTATPYANISFHVPAAMNVSLYLYPGVQLNATSAISVSHLDVNLGGKNNDKVLTAPTKFAGGKTTTTAETRVDGTLQTSAASAELKTNSLVAGMWVIVPGVRIVYR